MIMELRLKGDKTVFLLQFKPYVFKHTNRVKMIYCDIICSYDNNSVLLVVSTGPLRAGVLPHAAHPGQHPVLEGAAPLPLQTRLRLAQGGHYGGVLHSRRTVGTLAGVPAHLWLVLPSLQGGHGPLVQREASLPWIHNITR